MTHPRSTRTRDRRLSGHLVAWFHENARDLPWRRRGGGRRARFYRALVSEVMLQQTQVRTVVPYYQRWMQRLPTLEALAGASEAEVLALWAGLGYYRRARHLHRAARTIVADRRGRLPANVAELRRLPGIGPYSAGAIAALAFGAPEPAVDGNVARVLCRLEGWQGDPRRPPLETRLWERARALTRASDEPGRVVEGLMELGALVCTPASPACARCPWRRACRARRSGRPTEYPGPTARTNRRLERGTAVVVRDRRGHLLLCRRGPGALLGGLFEPPLVAATPANLAPRGEVRHVFTHIDLRLSVFAGRCARRADAPRPRPDLYDQAVWTRAPEALPLSALARKILAAVGNSIG